VDSPSLAQRTSTSSFLATPKSALSSLAQKLLNMMGKELTNEDLIQVMSHLEQGENLKSMPSL
jgi:hypothetical protein